MKKEKLERLAMEKSNPCVTISMKTNRSHPDNKEDVSTFKNLIKEAELRITNEYSNMSAANLIKKIRNLENEIDFNNCLDSLHIFVSDSTKEIIKSTWPTPRNTVHIAERFSIKPLIKIFNRTLEYLILLLTQSEAKLFHLVNDEIIAEITEENFPLKNEYENERAHLDSKIADNLVRGFLNKVDKAVTKIHYKTGLNCFVMCTDDNYSFLMQVADIPSLYIGHDKVNYKDMASHTIAERAWESVKVFQEQQRSFAINEMQDAIGSGKVITELSEIYKAAKEGRGDLLITNDSFHQAVRMTGVYTFDLVEESSEAAVIDDITSEIAWEVISKKGRAVFTGNDDFKSLGNIALKVRY